MTNNISKAMSEALKLAEDAAPSSINTIKPVSGQIVAGEYLGLNQVANILLLDHKKRVIEFEADDWMLKALKEQGACIGDILAIETRLVVQSAPIF